MSTQKQKTEAAIKRFVMGHLYAATAVCIGMLLILWPQTIAAVKIFFCILILFHVAWGIVMPYLPFSIIRNLLKWYILLMPLMLLPFAFFVAERNDPTTCLWFLLIPIACSVMMPPRQVMFWTGYALLLILLTNLPHLISGGRLFTYLSIPFHLVMDDSNRESFILANQLTLFAVFVLICHSLYYIHVTQSIRLEGKSPKSDAKEADKKADRKADRKTEVREKGDKYDNLFALIVTYTESEQGYRNPDFNISELSAALDSNVSYISTAIRKQRHTNFTTFVNAYRVAHVKRMLQQGNSGYTIEHLSTSSGFKHQTTFNKVFKASEGVTPTEFVKKL